MKLFGESLPPFMILFGEKPASVHGTVYEKSLPSLKLEESMLNLILHDRLQCLPTSYCPEMEFLNCIFGRGFSYSSCLLVLYPRYTKCYSKIGSICLVREFFCKGFQNQAIVW
jgi:hypothetical protein